MDVRTSLSEGAITGEFIWQLQHQSTKKVPFSMTNLFFFGANKVQCTFFLCYGKGGTNQLAGCLVTTC